MRAVRPLVVLLLAAAAWAVPFGPSAEAVSRTVTIAEVYGDAGGLYRRDYVVIHNKSGVRVVLKGMSLQYSPDGGQTWEVTPLGGSVRGHHYYLVAEGPVQLTGLPLPQPDATGPSSLPTSGGRIALVQGTEPLTCGADCDGADGVVDFVGYGTTTDHEGEAPAPAHGGGQATKRGNRGRLDTDDNAGDFGTGQPNPRTTRSQPYRPDPATTATPSPTPTATTDPTATPSPGRGANPTATPTPGPGRRLAMRCRARAKVGRTRRVVCRVTTTLTARRARLVARTKGRRAVRRARVLRNGRARIRLRLLAGRRYRITVKVGRRLLSTRLRVSR